MFPNPIRNNDSAVKNIGELLSYSDEQFVHKAFLALLGREPDREGMRYYLDRLKKGYSKEIIIVQLSASDEAREHNCQITGLEELLVKENRASHRLWRGISRGCRTFWQFIRLRFGTRHVQLVRSDMGPATREVFDKLMRAIAQKNKR
jgi:hypothetical protein